MEEKKDEVIIVEVSSFRWMLVERERGGGKREAKKENLSVVVARRGRMVFLMFCFHDINYCLYPFLFFFLAVCRMYKS